MFNHPVSSGAVADALARNIGPDPYLLFRDRE
jgi:hypothetical protein